MKKFDCYNWPTGLFEIKINRNWAKSDTSENCKFRAETRDLAARKGKLALSANPSGFGHFS